MKCNLLVDVGRRQFLRGEIVSAVGAAVATVMPAHQSQARSLARVDCPSNRLAKVADLAVNEPMDIAYPDADSPRVLLKLGAPVEGGVGPDGDIDALSVLCPHKGWLLTYNGGDRTLNCPGHYSRFDCGAGGQQTRGDATQNLPRFDLRVDDGGEIFAEGVDELNYAHEDHTLRDTIMIVGANPLETQTNLFLNHMVPGMKGGAKATTLNASVFKREYNRPTNMVKEAMDAAAGATREELVDALEGAIRDGGLF